MWQKEYSKIGPSYFFPFFFSCPVNRQKEHTHTRHQQSTRFNIIVTYDTHGHGWLIHSPATPLAYRAKNTYVITHGGKIRSNERQVRSATECIREPAKMGRQWCICGLAWLVFLEYLFWVRRWPNYTHAYFLWKRGTVTPISTPKVSRACTAPRAGTRPRRSIKLEDGTGRWSHSVSPREHPLGI